MLVFLTEHIVEIIFGLISAGALAFCKYMHGQTKNYKKMLKEKEIKEKKQEEINAELEKLAL